MQRDTCLDKMAEGAEAFLNHLAVHRNVSTHTLRAYQTDIQEFRAWLPDFLSEKQEVLEDVPVKTFRDLAPGFLAYLNTRKLARTSHARKISVLKTFFKFLVKERYFEESVLPLRFYRPKLQRKLPAFLSEEDVKTLLQATETSVGDACLQARNQAILQVLFSSGIRVSELIGLNFDDVHWEEGELRVMGKGERQRIAFISPDALSVLLRYRTHWPDLSDDEPVGSSPLFLNRDGNRLSVRSVARMLSELSQAAGFANPVHPHMFRHGFATHLMNHGVDLRAVQELLGHVSIRSTQIYTHLTTERLRRAYLQAHPRAQPSENH